MKKRQNQGFKMCGAMGISLKAMNARNQTGDHVLFLFLKEEAFLVNGSRDALEFVLSRKSRTSWPL